VPAESIKKERDIATAQAAASGKPPNIVEKMIEGGVQKYLKQVTLLGQVSSRTRNRASSGVESKGRLDIEFRALRRGEGIERDRAISRRSHGAGSKAKKDDDKSEKAA